ncbi:ChaN family lipoprotein [Pseudomonas fluorescens]|uniref:ChaN family lipoprotein n=1 Tax=Pseudomonas fluorescens TaxID=294 RepID=UPI0037481309
MRRLWLLLLVVLAGCQHAVAPAPVSGEIRDLHSGEVLTAEQLVTRLADPERLIIGEQHDNADHHAVQLWLLQALGEQRQQGSLLLEMLTPDQQPKVAAARQFPASADVAKALDWQDGWDWTLYGPIVRFALSQPYPLLAANLDNNEIRAVYRQAPGLSGARSNAVSVQNTLFEQISDSHCGLLPESQMPAMLAVQQQRDRRMAERLLAAPTPSILLAGAWHARKDAGVPLHVLDLGAADVPTVLMLAEQGEKVTAVMADYVWYTPATPKQDYCEQMRKQFGQ